MAESISQVTGHGATDIAATGTFENVDRTLVYSVVGSDRLRNAMKEYKKQIRMLLSTSHPDGTPLNGRFAMQPE